MTGYHKLDSLLPLVKLCIRSEDHWHSAIRFHSPHHDPGGESLASHHRDPCSIAEQYIYEGFGG